MELATGLSRYCPRYPLLHTLQDWYATLWDKINVEVLIEETKKLTKEVKLLNKAVGEGWWGTRGSGLGPCCLGRSDQHESFVEICASQQRLCFLH